VLTNAWLYYRSASRSELNDVLDAVEDHILSGGDVTEKAISQLNTNKYIQIHVTERSLGFIMGDEHFSMIYRPRVRRNENEFDMRIIQNKPYMWTERSVEYDGKEYNIQVFRPYSSEQRTMNMFLIAFVLINCIAIGVAYLAGRYISKKILKPVKDISATAESISIYDLEQRIEVPEADDEIRSLVLTFNDMIARLQESFNRQNQFISDASHELRTPIAVIQGYADLIDRWGKRDEEVLQESITSIKSETSNMSELVSQLLFLARGERAAKSVNKESVSLNEVAAEVVKEVSMTHTQVDIGLEATDEGKDTVYADYSLIKQLLRIFAENAVKYGNKENPIINIKTTNVDGKVEISVADNGMGITDEDLPYIFDRFYRGDKSRNKEISGNGLGLSIAKWIVEQHDAEVKVESEVGVGSTFRVLFNRFDG
jgi:signal transduction histidine kinase